MCGIVGILSSGADQTLETLKTRLVAANAALSHRGPDDSSVYTGPGIGLAARRLSIIDLTGGRQPLSNEDGNLWITYNGEIYNAPALRAELEALGHRFHSQTDTEVIVHAYEAWGSAALERLRGMFAFAIWDARQRQLFLARDRFGIKPLYYVYHGGQFAFASEVRPLFKALPALPREANPEALWRLFEVGFIPSPLTAFAHICSLPAAHYLLLEGDHPEQGLQDLTPRPYWDLTFPAQQERRSKSPSVAEASQIFLERLRETVEAWRLSDVPVGTLLSGGIDSAALAVLLAEMSDQPIHSFSIAFTEQSHDESAHAGTMARYLGSQHHKLCFSLADFDYLPQMVAHLETPLCSATGLPIYLLYQACHQTGFKVIMTGEGADELLGGYYWFDGDRRVQPWLALPRSLRTALARFPLPISDAGRRVLVRGGRDSGQRYALWQEVSAEIQRQDLLKNQPRLSPLTQIWSETYDQAIAAYTPLDQFLYLEHKTRLVDLINLEVDRMSMASSVEARPPFLDHNLWEFCATLPPAYKLGPGVVKRILREAFRGRLPEAIRQRPKQGLAAPHSLWWRQETLPAWAETALHPSALDETGYFKPDQVWLLRAEHQRGRRDHSRILTGVLTTQLWHEAMGIRPAG